MNDGQTTPHFQPLTGARAGLQALRGFWVLYRPRRRDAAPAVTLDVLGWPLQRTGRRGVNEQVLTLQPGWNLAGPCADFITAPAFPASLNPHVWLWHNAGDGASHYRTVNYAPAPPAARRPLTRGRAYWFFNPGTQPVEIDLGAHP